MAERYGAPVGGDRPSRGQAVIHPSPSQWFEVAAAARADGFDQLIDLTAVDYLTYGADRGLPEGVQPERFEVVASLMSHERRERLRMRVQVPADDPSIPTLFDLWPGAENLEREAYDMFGIVFEGHPDPSRILMPEDWSGHPLRKDYDSGGIPVQFKAASNVR
ncbi:MAG: NADH-quinone oxidoreductase subunit C [Acidimicrobiaceae bacterium]|nr:NADH-quinone oxidoreductase subunit C [Acidimicrobiaceae bacterium]MDE0657580.1 NADH-quinone oxidoreductase subunit C [Acidimicrobiaceae bacterium]MXZ97050.1 NADH-quinone oxidoreductase subunit C [Acidimicrobiaceae bacterium]MYF44184.1 NADH-quinone oxidoreductase subunit C [Acidimicrobiaceae bacterium]MYJ36706.1 NADH-quinone oxidoreductase subunit C [Acidimicrobiaceae bacterium]